MSQASQLLGEAHLKPRAHMLGNVILADFKHDVLPGALPDVHQHVGVAVLGQLEGGGSEPWGWGRGFILTPELLIDSSFAGLLVHLHQHTSPDPNNGFLADLCSVAATVVHVNLPTSSYLLHAQHVCDCHYALTAASDSHALHICNQMGITSTKVAPTHLLAHQAAWNMQRTGGNNVARRQRAYLLIIKLEPLAGGVGPDVGIVMAAMHAAAVHQHAVQPVQVAHAAVRIWR